MTVSTATATAWLIGVTALAAVATSSTAAAPSPADTLFCPDPEARQFDFWIGEWDVVNRNRPPEGAGFYETGRATDRVYPVVGGCGIVEHWRGQAISRFIVGFSVRAWDPATDEWLIVLLWPTAGAPSFGELRGGFHHGRGEFSYRNVTAAGDTAIQRFTFSDIAEDRLRWENGTSRDRGRTWEGNWIMDFTRRDRRTDAGLWNGPTTTTRRCPGPEHRRFDHHLGAWRGMRTLPSGDSVAVTGHLVPILEGCAVMERVWSDDGGWEAFRVRAWEPGRERWVEYELDSEQGALVRRTADPEKDGTVFQDVAPGPEGRFTRTRWEERPDGGVSWTREEAPAPEGPWTSRSTVRLDEPLGGVP